MTDNFLHTIIHDIFDTISAAHAKKHVQAHDYQYIYFLVVYLGRAKYSLSHGLTDSSITNKLHLLRRSFSGRSVNGMARLGLSVHSL